MRKQSDKIKVKIDHFLLFSRNKLYSYLSIVSKIAKIGALILSVLIVQTFIYQIGFEYDDATKATISSFYRLSVEYFTLLLTVVIVSALLSKGDEKVKMPYLFLYGMLLGTFLPIIDRSVYANGVPLIWEILSSETYRIVMLVLLSLLNISSAIIGMLGRKTSPPVILIISFAFIIMVGTGLLMMPNSAHHSISVIDALLLSTSAVCVTGLTPVEISEVLTPMGMTILAMLIQVGGLGLMTLTSFFTLFFMGNTSLYNQVVVSDIVSSGSVNSLVSTLGRILTLTFLIELLGFAFIWLAVHNTLGFTLIQEVKFALFHAVSAFCNAGFSTLTGNLANPLTAHNLHLINVISLLIILGGIGFPIIINVVVATYNRVMNALSAFTLRRNRSRRMMVYSINTKIVVSTTLILLVGGTLLIALFEWNGAFVGMSVSEKFTQAFFAATSPRTAGFNTLDLTLFSAQTYLLTLFLMWVGGGSQSTAGGVKVNAFAVSFAAAYAMARGKDRVEVMGRQLTSDTISRATTTIFVSVIILLVSIMTLSLIEPHISLGNIVFECISAIGTVGLSLGVTPLLSDEGKIVVVVLMFVGRIGIVTFLLGVIRSSKNNKYNYPKDDIIIT